MAAIEADAGLDVSGDVDTNSSDLSSPDSAPTDGASPKDSGNPDSACSEAGAWGCSCESSADCTSGLCTPGVDTHVCTGSCDSGCHEGWRCESVADDLGAQSDHCVPMYAALCRPCENHEDCELAGDTSSLCVSHADGSGSFCGAHCDDDVPCPDGYECQGILEGDSPNESQCIPLSPEGCSCSPLASEDSASTTCSNTTEHGTCEGQRSCGDNGLSECTAPVPSEDLCDGLDNDCDGNIDENLGTISCGQGLCEATVEACVEGVSMPCEPTLLPGELDETCNGLDDDCDGLTDEDLESLSCGIGLCKTSVPACVQGSPNECEPLFQPGEIAEACNGIDDDCDGLTDEDLIDCD